MPLTVPIPPLPLRASSFELASGFGFRVSGFPPFLAHAGIDHHAHSLPSPWTDWPLEPGVLIPLALSVLLYYTGLTLLWRRSAPGHGIRPWQAASFTAGWLALFVALATPLHPLGSYLFSAHMAQHEILMLVAAPLLVLGKPLIATLHALPTSVSRPLVAATRRRPWQHFWSTLTNPVCAWIVHGLTLWLWHLPFLFQATLTNEIVHAAQHLSFLGTALLFWYAVAEHRHRAIGYGMAVVYMFTTALHSGALGAILTFARTLWYPAYAHTTQRFGLSPVEDQQLGGLIMWVPACSVYIVAGLALLAAYLKESDRRLSRTPLLPNAATPAQLLPIQAQGFESLGTPPQTTPSAPGFASK